MNRLFCQGILYMVWNKLLYKTDFIVKPMNPSTRGLIANSSDDLLFLKIALNATAHITVTAM